MPESNCEALARAAIAVLGQLAGKCVAGEEDIRNYLLAAADYSQEASHPADHYRLAA